MKHVLQARGHEMELMGREKALAEALAVPVSPILSFSSRMTCTFTAAHLQYRYGLPVQVWLSSSFCLDAMTHDYMNLMQACFTANFAHLLRALCTRVWTSDSQLIIAIQNSACACQNKCMCMRRRPVSTAFLRAFCERLKREYGRDRRLGEKITQVEHFCSEVGQHLLVRPHNAR